MIRGINKQVIYNDKRDKDKFVEIMQKTKEETKYELYAYCLMNNHAHFIIKENDTSISDVMKKICGTYGAWYNYRHQRIGHVFQDRFKSECIETNSYFITVLKYIIKNPIKAKIVEDLDEYRWSSYREYIKKNFITDTQFYLNMLDSNWKKAKKIFNEEMKKDEIELINLNNENIRRTDEEAEEIINKEMKKQGIENVGEINLEKRILFIKLLKSKGISNRQIIQKTGLSRGKVIGI